MFTVRRPFVGLRRKTVLLLVAGLALGTIAVLPQAPEAASAHPRHEAPVRPGSLIVGLEDGKACTAGPVLASSALVRSAFRRMHAATRYVLTAKHCFSMGADVNMVGGIKGVVMWQSPTDDVEMILVLPHATSTAPYVVPGSRSHHVIPGRTIYDPRAFNDVITARSPHLDQLFFMRLTGTGNPGRSSAAFVTSGVTGGVFDRWFYEETPPAQRNSNPNTASASSSLAGPNRPAAGDSGGPVYSTNGIVYGVLSGNVYAWGINHLRYTPIDVILRQLGGAYHLA
ncbi:hypothetical protein DZF92_09700 [Clavibacter michiganensis subsp. insidiosus]|uniref:Uncharacterized protein n=1 Tax=Clavibacter michiganensis subsp. insidiosus TaxID=33014 RepID=A0A399SHV8_9MICO|nr:hypothetical protein [Clavibacter michiganensis]AWG02755.1 hypothetical protein BEH62_14265 [Clavibacter michiganensis subsp. insidiosus]OQJ58829.1 hypothetical protein B5P21_02105 [Clavibacter michiganensis subsp. insidiosus]RII86673.1 hypothetical protein DZF92_09700 [Clavibacter michiganensis subsp. insidiosus]RIJ43706.1 hypothetical protein DZF93_05565 [Clavibacter michiganensis subsp. insidiosus]RMC85521.1 hypothetical protein CmiCFBP2404_08370 [Clavibacter michiganensis subsp. insidio